MTPSPVLDLHCHILPGLDDGARSLDEALAMARMAVADGTTHLVATPHLHAGVHDNTPERVAPSARFFIQKLQELSIPLTLHVAAEVRLTPEVLRWRRNGTLPLLGSENGEDFCLLELPHGEIPPGSLYLVELLRRLKVIPVLAHPERNRAIRREVEALRPFLELGCLAQLTSGALCGGFGAGAQATAEELLRRGWGHLLASDGHGFHRRQPVLADGVRAAAQLIGTQAAQALVTSTPVRILTGMGGFDLPPGGG